MSAVESNRAGKIIIGALLAVYLLAVSWDTLKAPFAADEMLAIWTYWHPSPWRLLTSQFMMWRGYFRPMGGVFFLPIFEMFGLNPVPYHVVLLALLLAGTYLMYRLARAMGCGELAAAMAALIACYHGGLSNLYYNSVFVFDVLCGVFYFAALGYYARIRSSGRLPGGGQTALFLALFVCSLNSKEMAVTMPVMLLLYEWLFAGRRGELSSGEDRLRPSGIAGAIRWLRGPGQVIVWSGLINVLFIYGKRFGSFGLMKSPAYQPVITWERFVDFQERYIGDMFYSLPRFGGFATVAIWAIVTYLCWRRKDALLRFCWFYVVVTPIPIMFLIGRDMACLYVPLAGWAMLAGALFERLLPGATRVVSGEPTFKGMPVARVRTIVAAAIMVLMAFGAWSYKVTQIAPAIQSLSPHTAEVLAEFRAENPQVKPHAKVIFQDDPFPDAFDTEFIAEMWFHDRTTAVRLNQKTPLPPEEFAGADAIFTWRGGKLIRVR